MPMWSLIAAGRLPDGRAAELAERLAGVLADPAWQCDVSSLHIDGVQPVRAVLHLREDDPVAACA